MGFDHRVIYSYSHHLKKIRKIKYLILYRDQIVLIMYLECSFAVLKELSDERGNFNLLLRWTHFKLLICSYSDYRFKMAHIVFFL